MSEEAPLREAPAWLGKVVVLVGLVAILIYVSLLLAPVWVLLFGSVLVAVLLDAAAWVLRVKVFRNRLPGNQILWVLAAVLLLAAGLFALGYLLGPHIIEQTKALAERLPEAVDRLRERIAHSSPALESFFDSNELERLLQPSSEAGRRIAQAFGSFAGALGSAAIVLVIGFYLALQPEEYVRSCLMLVPRHATDRAAEVLRKTGNALQRWLLGRICSMVAVCALTTTSLWLLDVPLALSLGLLAGLFTFIPFIGPLLSALPAILLGLLQSELMALWIALAYVGVQAIEGNLITPLIQSYAVSLRPAVLLSAQLVAGSLFGFPGVIIATPLAVAVVVFVEVLYVRGHLEKDVESLEPDSDG